MRFFLFLLFISSITKGSSPDTLLPHILALPNDTEKVNELYKKGFAMRNSDPLLAYQYARHAERLAQQSGSAKHLAKSYNLLGVLYYKKGDLSKAANYHLSALELRIKCHDVLGIAHSENNLGNVYSNLKLFEKAEACYLKALAAYKEVNNKPQCASCLLNIGVLRQTTKDYDAAVENYNYALRMAEELNDQETKALCLNNLAIAYGLNGNVEKAIACNEDALKLRNQMENTLEAADSYLNLAPLYIYTKETAKAKQYLDTAAYIGQKYSYAEIMHKAVRNYAAYFAGTGDYEKAYDYMVKYEKISDSVDLARKNIVSSYEFTEPSLQQAPVQQASGMPNKLLLLSVIASALFFPYYLIRFKR